MLARLLNCALVRYTYMSDDAQVGHSRSFLEVHNIADRLRLSCWKVLPAQWSAAYMQTLSDVWDWDGETTAKQSKISWGPYCVSMFFRVCRKWPDCPTNTAAPLVDIKVATDMVRVSFLFWSVKTYICLLTYFVLDRRSNMTTSTSLSD